MQNLTYETYLTDPAARGQLEREARRARAEATYRYIVLPLMAMFRRVLRRSPPVAQLKLRPAA